MANYNCRICKSKKRIEVEKALGEGQEFREVAKTFLDRFDCNLHLLEQSLASHYRKHLTNNIESRELTQAEQELLKRFERGDVDLEEASRVVASRVFEKILRNPDQLKYIDFFRTELLKIKEQESTNRNNWATELMNRMFSGHLPPRNCPKCGYEIVKLSENIPQQPLES